MVEVHSYNTLISLEQFYRSHLMSYNNLYSNSEAISASIDNLLHIFKCLGANRVFFKNLSPNDNSKNQPYLAGDFADLGFLPTGELIPSKTTSKKSGVSKHDVKFTSMLDWYWISPDGRTYTAPQTKLIFYPQYPEVRLSGFSQGSEVDLDGWMDPYKHGRKEGRVLILGITDKKIFAYLAITGSRIAREIQQKPYVDISSVLRELMLYSPSKEGLSDKQLLIQELKRIHLKGLIPGKRLNKSGNIIQYAAQNGGGFTLEAELGIKPNGIAEPDFHGWEVKQFAVKKFHLINSKALTLMTPEPDGGIYKIKGPEDFVRTYGYKSSSERYDFTGSHKVGTVHNKTGLIMQLHGFNTAKGELEDAEGAICLLDKNQNIAASWSFAKIIEHWKRKHARAVYVPAISSVLRNGERAYHYGNNVRLFQGTDINKFLVQMGSGLAYYDPGINLKKKNGKFQAKRRNQFRIKSKDLNHLYRNLEEVDLLN